MNSKTALGSLGMLGIGIASAAALFVAHRSLNPDAPMPPWVSATFDADAAADAVARDELLARADGEGDEASATSDDAGTAPAAADGAAAASGRGPVAGAEPSPHIEALSHPSAAYRNASLATMIREAGYDCTGILSSAAGHEDLASWRVSCEGGRAYLVFEDRTGVLRVEPLAYFDSPVPFVPLELPPAPDWRDRLVPLPE